MQDEKRRWMTEHPHCDHEEYCGLFYYDSKLAYNDGTRCMRNHDGCAKCSYDSRTHTLAQDGMTPEQKQRVVWSTTFHLPRQVPSIVGRQLAYKDFERDNSESWCSLSDSPMLKDGDIIQIIRSKS